MNYPGSLHNHTDASNLRLRDSINTIKGLIDTSISLGHEVCAITEHDTVSSAIKAEKYYKKIKEKNPNFKLILGNEIYLCRNGLNKQNFDSKLDKYFHFILLAKDLEGHRQIREISTRAWNRSYMSRGLRRVPTYYQDLYDIIGKNPGHVIGSTACLGGALGVQLLRYKETKDELLLNKIKEWIVNMKNLFLKDNFFLEMQPSFNKDQIYVNNKIIELSKELGVDFIITNDAHYALKEDRPIHKAFLNSQDGDREVDEFYATTYLMTDSEIKDYMEKFIGIENIEKAYSNINKIKSMCEDYSLLKPLKIPNLKWKKPNISTISDFYLQKIPYLTNFINSTYEGDRILALEIVEKIEKDKTLQNDLTYNEINDNLRMVLLSSEKNKTHWSAYLLNLQRIIDVCWEAGTIVGPGRGSGVGFLLLYILGITQINPLREKTKTYSWRFLNPDRVSVLDIDIDIEGSRREQVLEAFRKVYGEDRVANVVTFGTEKSKSAILTACLAPDTPIYTTKGLKKIQDISNNDIVYTSKGEEQVITPTQREYDGELYSFNCSGIGKDFSVTHNHQLLVYTNRKKQSFGAINNYKRCQLLDNNKNVLGEFLSIKDAARYYEKYYNGSYSAMYKYKKNKGYTIVELSEIKNNEVQWLTADNIQKTDFLLSPIYDINTDCEKSFIFTKKEQNPYNKHCNYIKEEIKIDEDLGELIGIYLAEGNVNHDKHGITFTINVGETTLKDRIIYLINKCFDIQEDSIYISQKQNSQGLSIQINSTPLGRWFDKYCRGLAKEKRVPFQILNSNLSIQKRLLYGCFYGDGYGRIRENGSCEAKITSISYGLVQDLWQIAARNGYNSSIITEIKENCQETYNLMFYGKTAKALYNSKYNNNITYEWTYEEPINYNGTKYYKIRIKSIKTEKYKGMVYCLETPSHNYLLNNIVSHNCRGLGIDVDIAQYLSSLVPAERGITYTLSQCFYGDEENGIKPIPQFVNEMTNNYPELWKVAQKIEGLINRTGVHAGGVIFVDEPFTNSTAIMRAPDGTTITQFDLHDAEDVGLIKYDLLSVEAMDKIHICLDLLCDYDYVKRENSLKETYEKVIGIYNLERENKEMWKMIWEHKIQSLFQMEQQSGIQGIALTKPESVDDLATLNSVIRLMAQEKGAEQPLSKYARFKKDINNWYNEMDKYGLTKEEQELLKPVLSTSYGICESQERFMTLVQMPECGGFNLTWADSLRKAIAKKNPEQYMLLEKEYFKVIKEKGLSENLCNYVWKVLVAQSRGYGF